MNTSEDTRKDDQDFKILELGSVSEETRGGNKAGIEFFVGPNSRLV